MPVMRRVTNINAGPRYALAVALQNNSCLPLFVLPTSAPTVAEAGVPGFKADVCFGVVEPAGTPGEIIAKLNQELVAVMRMPNVEEQLRRQCIEPMTSTPKEFAAFLRVDIRKFNPASLVPVLVDSGQVLTESRIINEYLENA